MSVRVPPAPRASSGSTGAAASSRSSPSSSRSSFFVLLGSVYGDDDGGRRRHGLRVPARRDARLRRGWRRRSPASRSSSSIRREAGVLKRLRGTPLPAWAYVIARRLGRRSSSSSSRQSRCRARPRSSSTCRSPTSWLSVALDTAPRRAVAFAALGLGADRRHPLGRGVVGRRQRHLPADGLPRRLVLVDARVSARSRGDRRTCCRSTYFIELMRDVAALRRGDLVELGRTSPSSPRGASSALVAAVTLVPLGAAARVSYA